MKIAFIDTSNFIDYPIGGQLTSVKRMLDYFSTKEDIKIYLIGIQHENHNNIVNINNNIQFLSIYTDKNNPNNPKQSLRLNFMLSLIKNVPKIKKLNIDVFFLHNPESFFPIKIFFPRKKIALFSHGSFYNIFNHIRFDKAKNILIKSLLKAYLDWVIKKSSVVFSLDKKTSEYYSKMNKNVYTVTNSIDINKFGVSADLEKTQKAVFVGRLSSNKQVDSIIKAMNLVTDIQLDIFGEGEEYENLKRIIDALNIKHKISLNGAIDNDRLCGILYNYDILIINSIVEGMPMVILEALASGLAIITTKAGAIEDIIIEGENGYFTDGSPKGIAKAFEDLRSSDIVKIRKANRDYATKFDYKVVNETIYKTLKTYCNSIGVKNK